MAKKLNVAVVFGGKSVEHEVSVLTGLQIIRAIDRTKYTAIPVYISKAGEWFTGDNLLSVDTYRYADDGIIPAQSCSIPADSKIQGLVTPITTGILQSNKVINLDAVIPAVHGTFGEDGTLQGLLELANIPYTGCDFTAASIGMNKSLTKKVLKYHNLPVVDALEISRTKWDSAQDDVAKEILARFSLPFFVKPCNLGSSIGVKKISAIEELPDALSVIYSFDHTALVETNMGGFIEINCSVLGDGNEVEASPCEQPIPWQEFLTYEDKYMRGASHLGMKGADRILPAKINQSLTEKVQSLAKRVFVAIKASGLIRIDFFVNIETEEVFVNEINTTPGSYSFYLWQAAGFTAMQVVDKVIKIALDIHASKQRRIFAQNTGLLEKVALSGVKFGVKNI